MIELTTHCPQCRHRFDVSLEQLQQRKGLLRCAQCAHIFDAYDCAVTTPVSAPIKTPIKLPVRAPHLRLHFIGEAPLAGGIALHQPYPKPEVISRPIRSSQPIQDTVYPEAEQSPYSDIRVYLDTPTAASTVSSVGTQAHGLAAQPFTVPVAKPRPYYAGQQSSLLGASFWRVLLGLLLFMMAVQLLYIYRVQIANSVPFTRPVLQQLCDRFNCNLPYMREIAAIEVRQSALQEQPTLSSDNSYAYQLQLQLKNNLAWPQEWPTLVLSFSDAATAGMATIAIEPIEYLSADQAKQPFAAGAQQSIQMPVVAKRKKINGFSVEKYYP